MFWLKCLLGQKIHSQLEKTIKPEQKTTQPQSKDSGKMYVIRSKWMQKASLSLSHTYFSITEGIDCPWGGGVGGAGVGFFFAHFLWFRYWLHHLSFDCLSAIIMHWFCNQDSIQLEINYTSYLINWHTVECEIKQGEA